MLKNHAKKALQSTPRIYAAAAFCYHAPGRFWHFLNFPLRAKIWRILHRREVVKADIVLSIGNHCHAACHMQEWGLRKFASPLDWMKYYSLESVLWCFEREFRGFFAEAFEDENRAKPDWYCRYVVDKKTGMCAIHHFFKNEPLEPQIARFRAKQEARFARMKKYLREAKNIVLVGCREDSPECLEQFLRDFWRLLDEKFCKNPRITMINIREARAQGGESGGGESGGESKNSESRGTETRGESKTTRRVVITGGGGQQLNSTPSTPPTIEPNIELVIIEHCFENVYPSEKLRGKDAAKLPVWIGNYPKWGEALRVVALSGRVRYEKRVNLNDRL